ACAPNSSGVRTRAASTCSCRTTTNGLHASPKAGCPRGVTAMPAASAWRYSPSTAVTERPASPTRLPAWQALQTHARRLDGGAIGTLFAQDATRADRYALRHDGLYADFSKQLIDDAVHAALLELAEQTGLAGGIESLFAGEPLNFTEDRPALHMALRGGGAVPTPGGA